MATGISLCSGAVDGLGIAFKMAGVQVTHYVEYDAFCCANLRRLHPEAEVIEGDIRNVRELPYADVVFGGVPCQPFSQAGDRRGLADERHLWPEAYRLIRQSRPRCVVIENVLGASSGGLIDEVCRDLEAEAYTCGAFLVPACVFGAPHERFRFFVVAYTQRIRHESARAIDEFARDSERHVSSHQQSGGAVTSTPQSGGQTVGNTDREQRPHLNPATVRSQAGKFGRRSHTPGRNRTPQSRLGRAADGSAGWLDGLNPLIDFPGWPAGQGRYQHPYEPPRTVVDKTPHYDARIRALGNGIVWPQALPFALAIAKWLEVN